MFLLKNKFGHIDFFSYTLCLLPFFIITGPFLSGISLVLIAIYGLYKFFSTKIDDKYLFNSIIILFVFYFYLLLRSIFSEYPYDSLKASLFYFRYIFFIIGVYFLFKLNKNIILSILHKSLFFSFIIVSFSTLIHLILAKYLDLRSSQISGIFFSEQINGTYIAYLYPLVLSLSLNKKIFPKIRQEYFILFLLFISLFTVIFSGQRSAIILFLVSNIILLIGFTDYRKAILFDKRILILFFMFITFLIYLNKSISERLFNKTFSQIYNDGEITLFSKHHESHYITGINMFSKNEIFGIGPRLFRKLCNSDKYVFHYSHQLQYTNDGLPARIEGRPFIKQLDGCSTHPHNIFIEILAETGLIGFAFIIFLFLNICLGLIKNLKQKINNLDTLVFGSLTSLFIIFFPLIPSNSFFSSFFNIYIYLSLAIWLSLKNEKS